VTFWVLVLCAVLVGALVGLVVLSSELGRLERESQGRRNLVAALPPELWTRLFGVELEGCQ
jgi:hypothetical protein